MSIEADYSFASKLLHQIALSADFIADASFEIEQSIHGKKSAGSDSGQHVFVAGLARAGTTLLLETLYETGAFVSLTYRDMPFVLAPNLWSGLSGSSARKMKAKERAHGDGVLVDFDSPEALEEVFWRVNTGKLYRSGDALRPMVANDEVIEKFRQYIALILHRYKGSRYLSKNNNNILRLPSIRTCYPESLILIPFRNPLQHANSLMEQHIRFSGEQNSEPFIKKYMSWLGHHEFGQDHRPFRFTGSISKERNKNSINYWLELWIDCYQYLLKQQEESNTGGLFFSYDIFCNSPAQIIDQLLDISRVTRPELFEIKIRKPGLKVVENTDNQLVDRAMDIYSTMSAQFESGFNQ